MVRERVVETDEGIQGEWTVAVYDQMQRRFRDKGWMETKAIIRSGISTGSALEVGPGPGYLGLEWLKHNDGTQLTGLDISPDMISAAQRNAAEYGSRREPSTWRATGRRCPLTTRCSTRCSVTDLFMSGQTFLIRCRRSCGF